jgi:hypothetical protein
MGLFATWVVAFVDDDFQRVLGVAVTAFGNPLQSQFGAGIAKFVERFAVESVGNWRIRDGVARALVISGGLLVILRLHGLVAAVDRGPTASLIIHAPLFFPLGDAGH